MSPTVFSDALVVLVGGLLFIVLILLVSQLSGD